MDGDCWDDENPLQTHKKPAERNHVIITGSHDLLVFTSRDRAIINPSNQLHNYIAWPCSPSIGFVIMHVGMVGLCSRLIHITCTDKEIV